MANAQYSFKSPRRQLFSFPPDVISSMLENPSSPKGLMKLYQTCKYFYGKKPLLITRNLGFGMEKDEFGDQYDDAELHTYFSGKNVDHVRAPIWATNKIFIFDYLGEIQSLPTLYRYSINKIELQGGHLQFGDFVLLTSENKVNNFNAHDSSCVFHPNLSMATFEELLQHLPNIRQFEYFVDKQCSADMLQKLKKLKLNYKFYSISLVIFDVHPSFDMNIFCEFIMANSDANTVIYIYPSREAKEKLKLALQKMDPKWKSNAYAGLKEFFVRINSKNRSILL